MHENLVKKIAENIYCFPIPLPDNPLKWLNCYVIRGYEGQRSLLMDTGFNQKPCLDALLQGMQELGLRPELTDIFLTHLHSDHTGNAAVLSEMGCRVLMGEIDKARMNKSRWAKRMELFEVEGMPHELIQQVIDSNPGMLYAPKLFDAVGVADGDMLSYGGYELECIHVPGHTPGQICLYAKKEKILFSSDHILFDISPNITVWAGFEDPVGQYIESLGKIMELDVVLCLPAHRTTGSKTMRERAQELIAHHQRRLAETERIIRENPGIRAYDMAGMMSWRIRARSWAEFPPAQKNFAFLETLAHIEYLLARGKIRKLTDEDGKASYMAAN